MRALSSRVFPALRELAAGAGSAPQDERYRTHRAIRQLLELLAARKPLVLLLDDLHWADSGSVELLGSLLRRPPAASVLIVIALRPNQVPARLALSLDLAARGGVLSRLAALFLSQKTVETHIRNLFQKLGVSSRAEVARTVRAAASR
jgi:DNA-binding NarL/FixJ family response regulator